MEARELWISALNYRIFRNMQEGDAEDALERLFSCNLFESKRGATASVCTGVTSGANEGLAESAAI